MRGSERDRRRGQAGERLIPEQTAAFGSTIDRPPHRQFGKEMVFASGWGQTVVDHVHNTVKIDSMLARSIIRINAKTTPEIAHVAYAP